RTCVCNRGSDQTAVSGDTCRFSDRAPWTTAVVVLRLFSWCGEDDAYGFRTLRSTKLAHKALHRLIVAHEAVVRHQVLPDRFAIAPSCQALFDQLAILFTDTCRWRGRGTRSVRVL